MPVCEGCGGSYEEAFNFCPYCGRAKPEPPKAKLELDIKLKPSVYDCPLCENPSSVQKVSAIVAAGTAETNSSSYSSGTSSLYSSSSGNKIGEGYSNTSTNLQGFSQSKLAKKLASAIAPKEPKKTDFEYFPGSIGFAIIFFPLWLLGAYLTGRENYDFGPTMLALFCYGPIVATIGGFLVISVINSLNGSSEKFQAANEKYDSDLPIYQSAYKQWENLFYCHRHDVVYMMGSKQFAPSKETWAACIRWGAEEMKKHKDSETREA